MPSLTVVVVDDEPDYREIVRFLLLSLLDVVTVVGEAADGEEALAVVLRERPDIVITDLVMPRLDGIELTRRIRQELPPPTIILMSSFTEDAYRLMASDSGADAFVHKGVIDLRRAGASHSRPNPAAALRWERPAATEPKHRIIVCGGPKVTR